MNQRVELDDKEFHGSIMAMRSDDRFINFVSLLDSPTTFKITGVSVATLPGKKQVPCATLSMNGKPCKRRWLVTAKMNQMELCRRAGSNKPEKWVGLEVTLYADPNVSFGPKKVGGIRIK